MPIDERTPRGSPRSPIRAAPTLPFVSAQPGSVSREQAAQAPQSDYRAPGQVSPRQARSREACGNRVRAAEWATWPGRRPTSKLYRRCPASTSVSLPDRSLRARRSTDGQCDRGAAAPATRHRHVLYRLASHPGRRSGKRLLAVHGQPDSPRAALRRRRGDAALVTATSHARRRWPRSAGQLPLSPPGADARN